MKTPHTAIFFVLIILNSQFSILNCSAQQVQLKGVVTVQNSKTYTGKTQFVKNVEVAHINAQNAKTKDVTGDDGKFILNIKGVEPNTQTQITVIPHGEYADYVVVNEKELKDITLGRLTPVSVFICRKGELEQRQAEMVGINMRKLEERMEKDKKRLQKELDVLKTTNDYLSVRYTEIKDSLEIISFHIDNAFERIKEYAKMMTLENLDERDANYVKAYECFSRGALDSVSYYLPEYILDLKYRKILLLQQEAKNERDLATILTESAKAKAEFSENSLNELLKEWLLLARAADMQNNYEKAMNYYEKIAQADSLNTDNILECADYLYKINEYDKAEKYYLQCLRINRELAYDNPKYYLHRVAQTLNNLAILHKSNNNFSDALREYIEALEIRRELAAENSTDYLPYMANTLNDLANLRNQFEEYPEALQLYKEALKIRKELAENNPKYLAAVAQTLNNVAVLHLNNKEYLFALQNFEDAFKIRKELALENPKNYLPAVAQTLNNLAIVHKNINQLDIAEEKYEEALEIRRKLAVDNPKVYLSEVAQTLNNLGILYYTNNDFSEAMAKYEEALEIRKTLALETPKKFLPEVAFTLNCLAALHLNNKDYSEALKKYQESLKIYNEFAEKTSKIYLKNILNENTDISECFLFMKDYYQAEEFARKALAIEENNRNAKIKLAHALLFQNRFPEAETIYKELSNYTQIILDDFEALKNADAIPEKCKDNVEKIRLMINE
jgi:tetratricopeptide (TPR) repeat protein